MMNFQRTNAAGLVSGAGQEGATWGATRLIWVLLGLFESLFALRLLLTIMGTNPANLFMTFLYTFTGIFLVPFIGLTRTVAASGMTEEILIVIAMVVYALLGVVFERAAWAIFFLPYAAVAAKEMTIINQQRR